MGFGLATRDSKGALILTKTIKHSSRVDPVLAEAMAVKEALSWIDEIKWPSVTPGF